LADTWNFRNIKTANGSGEEAKSNGHWEGVKFTNGTQAAHDAHRRTAGGGGTFELLLPRLRLLLAARPYSSVMMVVNTLAVLFNPMAGRRGMPDASLPHSGIHSLAIHYYEETSAGCRVRSARLPGLRR
jgi:hypothetical protein